MKRKHPVRIISGIIDGLDIQNLIKTNKPGGTSCYHPKMLLKVLIYGYLSNIYSSRKMEQALKENIHFMWLSAMSRPDHNTLNRFRSDRLKGEIKAIFTQIVLLLEKEGLVSLKTTFVDGTKIEANANRYTFVWGRSVKKQQELSEGRNSYSKTDTDATFMRMKEDHMRNG